MYAIDDSSNASHIQNAWWKTLWIKLKNFLFPKKSKGRFILVLMTCLLPVASFLILKGMHVFDPPRGSKSDVIWEIADAEPCGFDDKTLYPRKEAVQFDAAVLQSSTKMKAQAFGTQVVLHRTSFQDHGTYRSWFGHIGNNKDNHFIFVQNGSNYSGRFVYRDQSFVMKNCGGGFTLAMINPAALPLEELDDLPEISSLMEDEEEEPSAKMGFPFAANILGAKAKPKEPLTVIDIMVGYTDLARKGAAKEVRLNPDDTLSARLAMETDIILAVEATNRAFSVSELAIQLQVRGMFAVPSDPAWETKGKLGPTLWKLGTDQDIQRLRDALGADLVCLFVERGKNAGDSFYYNFTDQSSHNGFSVVRRDCATNNFSMPHEIGHNLGLDHQCEIATRDGAGHGRHYRLNHKRYQTIMSKKRGYTRLLQFSDASKGFGAAKASETKQACTSDEVAVLKKTGIAIANYRPSKVSLFGQSLVSSANPQPKDNPQKSVDPQPQ